jgi:hypothetical protein
VRPEIERELKGARNGGVDSNGIKVAKVD